MVCTMKSPAESTGSAVLQKLRLAVQTWAVEGAPMRMLTFAPVLGL